MGDNEFCKSDYVFMGILANLPADAKVPELEDYHKVSAILYDLQQVYMRKYENFDDCVLSNIYFGKELVNGRPKCLTLRGLICYFPEDDKDEHVRYSDINQFRSYFRDVLGNFNESEREELKGIGEEFAKRF